MLFLGSLVVAVAVEKWNLHKRLALRTLTLVGPEPKWLLLGIMLPTWFLSMWMSNTATTAMMVPIVTAILQQIKACQTEGTIEESMMDEPNGICIDVEDEHGDVTKPEKMDMSERPDATTTTATTTANRAEREKQFLGFAKTFSLATAYSANIGGMATLTGTPPNVIFKGLADELFASYGERNPVNFANWIAVGLPLSLILFVFLWMWMLMYSQGWRCLLCWRKDHTSYERVRETLRREYARLGPMSFAEVVVTINFIALALLWITRSPGFMVGWGSLFKPGFVKDSTPAVFIAVILFILPARPPSWMGCCRTKNAAITEALYAGPAYEPILDWDTVNKRLAWGVLLLMGGGFAMADACQASGLSEWMSENLGGLSFMSGWTVALLLSILIAGATEVTSNAATTTLFIPIVGALAVNLGLNPLYLMIPCTIAASLAFILPVATPPNAIVFATGFLRVKDMALAGIPMNIVAIIALNLALNTWIAPVYDIFHVQKGFLVMPNSTMTSNVTTGLSTPNVLYNITT
ncbi:solute carrier family 13 member 5 [Aplysia californica]|uniref:Solute carrier family 13 member 5 n=1 Tax=Aplysia californica TaxID=6500 RepID=A0ABM1ACA5_APLCA|nr:solute carrier family 13 member 5 [Aplysia californica]